VAQLTLRQFEDEAQSLSGGSPSVIYEEEAPFTNVFADAKGKGNFKPSTSKQHKPTFDNQKKENREENNPKKEQLPHHTLPKMQFPNFAGEQPRFGSTSATTISACMLSQKTCGS
jgi:hypothetical protein